MVINLLPEREKKELEREKIWKKIFVILFFVLIFLGIFILILVPLRIYIASKTESLRVFIEDKQEALKEVEFKKFQETTKEANQILSKVQVFWAQQLLITPIFEQFSSLLPDSIYLTDFSLQKTSKKVGEITKPVAVVNVSGWADTRENLYYFKQKLEKENNFKDIRFSQSSWMKPTDINFSLRFEFIQNDFE